jgi:thioredoxin 1
VIAMMLVASPTRAQASGFGASGLTERDRVPTFLATRLDISRRAAREVPMSTTKVTDASFEADVLKSTAPVVVDFWAEWCGPCKMIGPSLEEIATEMQGKVTIAKLNVDENPNIASKLGIRSIPTLMIFKDGKLASQKVGAAPKGELTRWITEAI